MYGAQSFTCLPAFTDEETKAQRRRDLPEVPEAREQVTTRGFGGRLGSKLFSPSFNHTASPDLGAGIWGRLLQANLGQ